MKLFSLLVGFVLLISATSVAAFTLKYDSGNYTSTEIFSGTPPTSELYTTSMKVTGTIELSGPLGSNLDLSAVTPVSFSFFDGKNTIDSTNATFRTFRFSTDALGNITGFRISISRFSPISGPQESQIMSLRKTEFDSSVSAREDLCGPTSTSGSCSQVSSPSYSQGASNDGTSQTLTVHEVAPVPLPASALFLLAGLGGLAVLRRKS